MIIRKAEYNMKINMRKLVNKLMNFTKRLTMPQMKSPGIEISRKYINSGFIQQIVPKHHGCTIEIVSVSRNNQSKDTKSSATSKGMLR